MAFTTGIATDHHDLLNRLRKYIAKIDGVHSSVYTGTGNGTMTAVGIVGATVSEIWTVTCITAAVNGGTFSVVGSVSGAQANATVGVAYDSGEIQFTINDGAVDFIVGDNWVIEVFKSNMGTAWSIQEWVLGATLADPSTLVTTGPGIVGGQLVNLSFKSEADTGTNAYAWKVYGHPDYDSGLGVGLQLNNSPVRYFLLWPNAITYWFYVNNRRIIVVAKIGSYYMSMYAGFFLPYALPAEYPFPYYIGATWNTLAPYNEDNSGVRGFFDPGAAGAVYQIRETLLWRSLTNSNNSANDVDSYSAIDGAMTWPLRNPALQNDTNTESEIAWSQFRLLRPLIGGIMPMWQVHILDSIDRTMVGVLDGVFVTGGFNRSPEQIVTFSGQNYRHFINTNRATPKHFFTIEES